MTTETARLDHMWKKVGAGCANYTRALLWRQVLSGATQGYVKITRRVAEATGYVYHAC